MDVGMIVALVGLAVVLVVLVMVLRRRNPPLYGHSEAHGAGHGSGSGSGYGDSSQSTPLAPTTDGKLTCPMCSNRFRPPDIMILTKADVRRYGRDPVQCPQCDHIWNAKRKIKRIRS